jgi:hypothetical protein
MTPRRLLGAATAVLLTGTMVGAAPAGAADDNARSRWDSRRIVQTPGAAEGPVHLLGGNNDWGLMARQIAPDTWRLREHRPGDGNAWRNPLNLPPQVADFRYDENSAGEAFIVYEANGKVYAAEHHDEGIAATLVTELGAEVPGETPVVVGGQGGTALVAYGNTWAQHEVGDVPGSTSARGWNVYPDPNVDGVSGAAGRTFGFTADTLLAFWNEPNGDLRVARRALQDTAAAFSAPQTIAAGERAVRLAQTAQGTRLVTQSTDGSVNLYTYTADAAGFSFTDKRVLSGPLADAPAPQVLTDAMGTLTIAWKETGVQGGGVVLWQQDRPESTFLERGNLVPGTRDSDARVVVSPQGSIAVALRRADETGIVRVKHLPAGTARWTTGVRLVSPKPNATSTAWAIGRPSQAQELRVAVNDTVGVYGFRFDAPRPYTKMTKPVRRTQSTKTYRIGWATSWTFADDWQVRMRLDKGRRYGAWQGVNVEDGARSKVVNRARGKTWCYSARARLDEGVVTPWSKQRCVTVRR